MVILTVDRRPTGLEDAYGNYLPILKEEFFEKVFRSREVL